MFSSILFDKVTVLCPTHHHYIDVSIRYITEDGKLFLVDSQGCDLGYNGSKECKECLSRCIEIFKANF